MKSGTKSFEALLYVSISASHVSSGQELPRYTDLEDYHLVNKGEQVSPLAAGTRDGTSLTNSLSRNPHLRGCLSDLWGNLSWPSVEWLTSMNGPEESIKDKWRMGYLGNFV